LPQSNSRYGDWFASRRKILSAFDPCGYSLSVKSFVASR
jgi:hypothetical protein